MGRRERRGGRRIPDTVRYTFWIGGAALFAAVLWTIVTTREYSPEEMAAFGETADHPDGATTLRALAARSFDDELVWIAAGALVVVGVEHWALEKEVYLLGGLLVAYGLASMTAIALARERKHDEHALAHRRRFFGHAAVMKRLALVQFFSWSALFIMWINTTPVVAQYFFGRPTPPAPPIRRAAIGSGCCSRSTMASPPLPR